MIHIYCLENLTENNGDESSKENADPANTGKSLQEEQANTDNKDNSADDATRDVNDVKIENANETTTTPSTQDTGMFKY